MYYAISKESVPNIESIFEASYLEIFFLNKNWINHMVYTDFQL